MRAVKKKMKEFLKLDGAIEHSEVVQKALSMHESRHASLRK